MAKSFELALEMGRPFCTIIFLKIFKLHKVARDLWSQVMAMCKVDGILTSVGCQTCNTPLSGKAIQGWKKEDNMFSK